MDDVIEIVDSLTKSTELAQFGEGFSVDSIVIGIFTFLGIVFASILAFILSNRERKVSAEKERYFSLYAPYIFMIYHGLHAADFSSYIREKQRDIIKHLSDNIAYASNITANKIHDFYRSAYSITIDEVEVIEEISIYSEETEYIDKQWSEINNLIISEYKALAKKLHYADLTKISHLE